MLSFNWNHFPMGEIRTVVNYHSTFYVAAEIIQWIIKRITMHFKQIHITCRHIFSMYTRDDTSPEKTKWKKKKSEVSFGVGRMQVWHFRVENKTPTPHTQKTYIKFEMEK